MYNYVIKSKEYFAEREKSQGILMYIALYETDSIARKIAVEKITDQETLQEVFLKFSGQDDIKKIALKKLSPRKLKEIALNAEIWFDKKAALNELKDEDLLLEFAMNSSDEELIIESIKKLPKAKIKQIKTNNWYVKAVCEDIINNQ